MSEPEKKVLVLQVSDDDDFVSPSKLQRDDSERAELERRHSIVAEPGLVFLSAPVAADAATLESPASRFIDEEWSQAFVLPERQNSHFSDEFLLAIPKTDLHLHLDGSIRIETLIDLAQQMDVELPSYTVAELRADVFKDQYRDLADYLRGFAYVTSVMRTAYAMERVAYEVACDSFGEGVRYIEVRFAPQLHVDFGAADEAMRSIEGVLACVNTGLARAAAEYNESVDVTSEAQPAYHYGIIACAMRFFNEHFSPYYRALCQLHSHESSQRISSHGSMALVTSAIKARAAGVPIVALDIAGEEAGHPADWHTAAYNMAHKNFMSKTVHAGEGYGPQSIFQAITDLHADRIGHGYHLFSADMALQLSSGSLKTQEDADVYVQRLVEYVADRRITFEVCLTSNLQTMPELKGDLSNHHLKKMLDNKMSVTLATDNRLVSNTSVCKEYRLAADFFNLTPKEMKEIVVAGFKRSFYWGSYKEKRKYVRSMIDYYEALERKHLGKIATSYHG